MKLYTIKACAAVLLCLVAFTSCDTDAEGTKYDISGVEAAFASTQMSVEVGAEITVLSKSLYTVEIQV